MGTTRYAYLGQRLGAVSERLGVVRVEIVVPAFMRTRKNGAVSQESVLAKTATPQTPATHVEFLLIQKGLRGKRARPHTPAHPLAHMTRALNVHQHPVLVGLVVHTKQPTFGTNLLRVGVSIRTSEMV